MAIAQLTYPLVSPIGIVGQIINGETSNRISRTVESAAGLAFGQPAFRGTGDHGVVVGGTFAATGAGSAAAGNTGAQTITASPPAAAGAVQGRYRLVAISAGATAAFLMYDPNGLVLGDVITGTPATIGGVGPFTITDAGTDPAIGDVMYIDVTYTANAQFIGLAVLDHVVPAVAVNPDLYPQYYTANLMTSGQMVVMAGASVSDGQQVYWNPATGRYTNTATHILIPNAVFDTTAVDGGLVIVGLKTRIV